MCERQSGAVVSWLQQHQGVGPPSVSSGAPNQGCQIIKHNYSPTQNPGDRKGHQEPLGAAAHRDCWSFSHPHPFLFQRLQSGGWCSGAVSLPGQTWLPNPKAGTMQPVSTNSYLWDVGSSTEGDKHLAGSGRTKQCVWGEPGRPHPAPRSRLTQTLAGVRYS